MLGIGNRGVRVKFESNSDVWNREWRRSSHVRGLESEVGQFESNTDIWNR